MESKTKKMFEFEKEGAIKNIKTALSIYRRGDYDRFAEFVNNAFLSFEDEEDGRGRIIGKSLLITYGGPTFYIFRDLMGNTFWFFSWEKTIRRKVRANSKAERLIDELFSILE